jgi:hypothetical protein
MGQARRLTCHRVVQLSAASAALPLVHIRATHAAGNVNVGSGTNGFPMAPEIAVRIFDRAVIPIMRAKSCGNQTI